MDNQSVYPLDSLREINTIFARCKAKNANVSREVLQAGLLYPLSIRKEDIIIVDLEDEAPMLIPETVVPKKKKVQRLIKSAPTHSKSTKVI